MIIDMWYVDEEYDIKKRNRREKIDKRARANQDFMKVNNIGVKKVILPIIEKRAKEAREKRAR